MPCSHLHMYIDCAVVCWRESPGLLKDDIEYVAQEERLTHVPLTHAQIYMYEWTVKEQLNNHISLKNKPRSLQVPPSETQGTGHHLANTSAVLGWPRDGEYYLMHVWRITYRCMVMYFGLLFTERVLYWCVGSKTISIFWMCTGSPQHSPPVESTAAKERVHEQVSVERGGGRGNAVKKWSIQNRDAITCLSPIPYVQAY